MHTYNVQQFSLPELKGLSPKQIEVHLKLYEGYVKFVNHLRETLADLRKDSEKNAYALGEVMRRFGFEFNGMRMHELYFESLERGAQPLESNTALMKSLSEKYGSFEDFWLHFKNVGLMRGIGWTILYHDTKANQPHVAWVNDHELGVLSGLPIILAMDMWEHAYMVDYLPAEKAKYIEAFASNLNWEVMSARFDSSLSVCTPK